MSYGTISRTCQDGTLAVQMGIATWFTSGLTFVVQEIHMGTLRPSELGKAKYTALPLPCN
jgi:hypothetical protein